ncbi:MAG: preprotein translocase subunit YajC [Pseudomonadota bacterium]|nr:preprotein translocase subunit YajC [Pseudomonadota bacterium]
MLISDAFAAAGEAGVQSGSVAVTLTQLGLILLIFYFFLIRPQTKKIKEHTAMTEALKVGDRVLTSGGIYGTITKLNGSEVVVEIAAGVNVTVERMTINGVVAPASKKGETKPAKTKTKMKKTK